MGQREGELRDQPPVGENWADAVTDRVNNKKRVNGPMSKTREHLARASNAICWRVKLRAIGDQLFLGRQSRRAERWQEVLVVLLRIEVESHVASMHGAESSGAVIGLIDRELFATTGSV